MKIPELFARAVEMIGGKAPSTRADVEAALRDCEARASSATVELKTMAARRPDLLVGATDGEVEKHDTAAARTALERDRADAIAARLRERLAIIIADEAAAELARHRPDVELQCDLAVEALRTRYPKAVAEVFAVLRTIATARAAVADFERAYPREPRIADPEHTARTLPAIADEVVSEREVYRWEYFNGNPLEEMYYRQVEVSSQRRGRVTVEPYYPSGDKLGIIEQIEAGDYHGSLSGPFERLGDPVRLVRKRRREVKRPERVPAPFDLHQTVNLPGLLSTDPSCDVARSCPPGIGPDFVVATLEECSKPRPRRFTTVVEYLPA